VGNAPPATIRDRETRRDRVVGVLVAVDGPLAGESHVIYDGENVMGRDPDCRVALSEQDRRISRRHANLIHKGGRFAIEPLGSEPTRVDGIKLEKGPLTAIDDGSTIYMGWTEFRFRTLTS
jgi:predicted component of type VI protein secretion system